VDYFEIHSNIPGSENHVDAVDEHAIRAENVVRSRPQAHYKPRRYDMTVRKAIEHFKEHQRTSLKRRTQEGYRNLLERFQSEFCEREVESIKAEELCRFLETCTEGLAKSTRRLRYAQLRAVFNFIIDTFEMNIKNPCCVPQLFKSFKNVQQRPRKILDKETVDEIIFNSASARDRLILELQARCGLRTEEVGGTRSLRIVEVISPPKIKMAMVPLSHGPQFCCLWRKESLMHASTTSGMKACKV
jgi:integrase